MKIKLLAVTMLYILCFDDAFADVLPDKGKTIFTTRCTSCHNVNAQLVGPALAGVDKRHSEEWLLSFIRSPKTLIEKKDKDAVDLYNKFNQIIMPDHQDITEDDVKNVLAYIKSETKTDAVSTVPFAKPGKIAPNYHPLTIQSNYGFFLVYLFLVFVFVLLLAVAVNIKDLQRKQTLRKLP